MTELNLDLLGGFEARIGYSAVALDIPRKKAAALLAFLAMPAGRKRSRDEIADLFWSYTGEEGARNNLRQTLHVMRRMLPDYCGLEITPDSILLLPNYVSVDVAEFEMAAEEATLVALERAANLYVGDFLHGFSVREDPFEQWQARETARLQDVGLTVFERLMIEYMARNRHSDAVHIANRVLVIDPLHEVAHQTLMRIYLAEGRNGLVRQQYEECRDVLTRELGIKPSAQTVSIYAELSQAAAPSLSRPVSARPASTFISNLPGAPTITKMSNTNPRSIAGLALFAMGLLVAATIFLWSPTPASSLQDAIHTGDVELVRIEIEKGADVNEADFMLGLPLMIAARDNHVAIAEALVNHGANVNGMDISGSALHSATYAGNAAMVEFLISKGADVNAAPDGVITPLHHAAANDHIYIIKLLIRRGASVNSTSGKPSALHISAGAGHQKAVELLIANGANVMHRDNEGDTPVHRAAIGGYADIIKLLLDAGADIEAEGTHSYTPLEVARAYDRTEITELLLQRGATH